MYHKVLSDPLRFSRKIPIPFKKLLQGLLERDASKRFGSGESSVESQQYFADIDWNQVAASLLVPPYIPQLSAEDDVKCFDPEFVDMTPRLSHPAGELCDQALWRGFSYTDSNITKPSKKVRYEKIMDNDAFEIEL